MSVQPVFIVSSGRSGSAMMHKALTACNGVEMHHEYCCTHVQRVAVKYYMGLAGEIEVQDMLREIYEPALELSQCHVWGDSSNKLSWIIPELAAYFPEAKFIHLVRDGRKVSSSYFHKLGDECYDDFATHVMRTWAASPVFELAPPPEKRYWWPQPPKGHPLHDSFQWFDQFQRIAFHWAEINRITLAALAELPKWRKHTVRLEDLTASPEVIKGVTEFIGVEPLEDLFAMLQRPHNVNRPEDTPLTSQQAEDFEMLAQDMMDVFGYAGTSEYVVNY